MPSLAAGAEYRRCRGWLLPALLEDSEEDLIAELEAGRAQLWPCERSAFVTQLLQADEPLVHIWLAGGDLAELVSMVPGLSAWGRAQGARALGLHGRRGWARALQAAGFVSVGAELRKGL